MADSFEKPGAETPGRKEGLRDASRMSTPNLTEECADTKAAPGRCTIRCTPGCRIDDTRERPKIAASHLVIGDQITSSEVIFRMPTRSGIEDIQPKLQLLPLRQPEAFGKAQVQVFEVRSTQDRSFQRARNRSEARLAHSVGQVLRRVGSPSAFETAKS